MMLALQTTRYGHTSPMHVVVVSEELEINSTFHPTADADHGSLNTLHQLRQVNIVIKRTYIIKNKNVLRFYIFITKIFFRDSLVLKLSSIFKCSTWFIALRTKNIILKYFSLSSRDALIILVHHSRLCALNYQTTYCLCTVFFL